MRLKYHLNVVLKTPFLQLIFMFKSAEMRKLLLFLLTFSTCGSAFSQNLFISTGAEIFLQPGAELTIQGNLQNNGTISGSGNFRFKGTALQSINGTAVTNFHILTIDNPAGVELNRSIGVNNQLLLTSGLLNMKTFTIILNPAATLSGETETRRITGTAGGYIEITVPIAAAATVNPGNLGVIINPAANMGNVTVRRGHDAQTISPAGRPSVNRYYDITPTINTALNASLNFNYFDAELNSRNEALLSFWTSPDNTTWTAANFSNRNTATNFVQLTGINSLPKRWTLTDQQFATGVFDLLANNKTLKLWPNPVADNNTIYIQLSANKRTAASLSVIDLSGRIVSIQMINMERGINTIQLNNLNLAAGAYTVLLKAEDGSSSTIGFIKK